MLERLGWVLCVSAIAATACHRIAPYESRPVQRDADAPPVRRDAALDGSPADVSAGEGITADAVAPHDPPFAIEAMSGSALQPANSGAASTLLSLPLTKPGKYVLIFNVTKAWNDGGAYTAFRMFRDADKVPIAAGQFGCGSCQLEHIPLTLVAVEEIPSPPVDIKVEWQSVAAAGGGGTPAPPSHVDSAAMRLIAVRVSDQTAHVTDAGLDSAPGTQWKTLLSTPTDPQSPGGPHLLVLNVPDTWNDQAGMHTWFDIQVNDTSIAVGRYTTNASGQRVPFTLLAATDLAAGLHTLTARWRSGADGGTSFVGDHPRLLAAIPLPHAAAWRSHQGEPKWSGTTSGYEEIATISPLDITENGDHLAILATRSSWALAPADPNYHVEAHFELYSEPGPISSGGMYSTQHQGPTELGERIIPFVLFWPTSLQAGKAALAARWRGKAAGYQVTLGSSPAQLISVPHRP